MESILWKPPVLTLSWLESDRLVFVSDLKSPS